MQRLKNILKTTPVKSMLIIWGLILVSSLIIFYQFLFGDSILAYNDIGGDTMEQYLMHYNTIVNHLLDGNMSLWDFNNGYGMNMLGLNLFNPFLIILYLAGAVLGLQVIPKLLVFIVILEMLLGGLFLYIYASHFKISEPAKIAAAYIYAFNGFLLVWGQHYQFGAYTVFMPLLLYFAEKAIEKKKINIGLSLITTLFAFNSVYTTYMALLFTGIYIIFRVFMKDHGSLKERIWVLCKCYASILLGLALSMVIFLPTAHYLLNVSSRIESNTSLTAALLSRMKLLPDDFYISSVYRMFSSNYQGTASLYYGFVNYYEAPVLFCTALCVLALLQYVFTIHRQNSSLRKKILQYLIFPTVFFFYFIEAGASIFNAFVSATFRQSFVIMPVLGLMIGLMLDRIFKDRIISYAALVIGIIGSVCVYIRAWQITQVPALRTTIIGTALITVVMAIVLFAAVKPLVSKRLLYLILIFCIGGNIIAEGYWCYNERDVLKKSDGLYFEELYGNDITAAIDYIYSQDDSFFRIEKDYESGSSCMDALAQNYDGISSYNGTQNKYIQEFVKKFIPNMKFFMDAKYNYRQIAHDLGFASLSGIKYIISQNPNLTDVELELVNQFGKYYVYRNTCVDSIGSFYTATITEADYESYSGNLNTEKLLSEVLILEDATKHQTEISEIASELEPLPAPASDLTFRFGDKMVIPLDTSITDNFTRMYLEFDVTCDNDATCYFYTDNLDSTRYQLLINGNETAHIRLTIPPASTILRLGSYNDFGTMQISNLRFSGTADIPDFTASSQYLDIPYPENDSNITGTVDAPKSGYVRLAVPYEKGWSVSVDGEPAELLKADYGFCAFYVAEGAHTFTLQYRTPWLIPGAAISALACVTLIGIILTQRKRKQLT